MQLPSPIHGYFAAIAPQDGAALAAAFAPDAIVRDEGQSHHGPQAIRDWWQAAKARYRHQAEPMDLAKAGGTYVVTAMVTGDFPASPAMLTFRFGLTGDGRRIRRLDIG